MERGRQRYAERGGTWPDRTRRVVARAHKLKPAPRVVIAASLPTHPPASLAHPSALRYVALCDVRLTNPTPPPRRSFVRSVGRSVPPPLVLSPATASNTVLPLADPPPLAFPACPPTDPRNRSLPYHRATPRTDSPSPDPPASRPTPLRFARLRSLSLSRSSLSSDCRPRCGSLRSPSVPLALPGLPLPRDARRHHPLRATSTPESRAALWNTTGSPAIIFCPIICRVRVYACERTEMGEPKKGRVENDHLEAITKQRRIETVFSMIAKRHCTREK